MNVKQLEFDFDPPRPVALLTPDEIFDRLDQGLLETLREDRRLERKPATFSGEQLGEYIVMWANTKPDGGLMLLGVADDGVLVGCSWLSADQLNRIEKVDLLCSDAICETKRVSVTLSNGCRDFVVAIRVKYLKRRVAKTPKGDVFARSGDEKRKLKHDEIRLLQEDKGEIDFEQEPCGLSYPKDFDVAAIAAYCNSVRAMCEITTDPSDEDILVCKHLATRVSGNLVPNMACALLFANEPDRLIPGCKVRFMRFDGDQEFSGERRNAVKDIWLDGLTVPKLIQKAADVLDAQIRTFSALGKDGKFYAVPEYPRLAWYEAIVNACVHRCYGNGLKNMQIFVRMFDSRLEIDSPGPFPPMITPENILGNSHPRNPKLMHALYFLRYVKMAGEGTRRIHDTMEAAGLPAPEFSEKQLDTSRVRVTLRNNIQHRRQWVDRDAAHIVGAALAQTLNEDEKRVLNFVVEYQKINVTEAVRVTRMAWDTAKKMLESLAARGILVRIGRKDIDRDPFAHYSLPSKAGAGSAGGSQRH